MEDRKSGLVGHPRVAEILGLYGPTAVSELLVQKLWLRREFRVDGFRTTDGVPVKIIHPGRWNRLGGPDFLGAEIELDGRRVLGDVEVHFYLRDWRAHRHHENPAFDGVVLHVVVFDPDPDEPPARTAADRALPTVVLAPRIREGLEEYAVRDALRALENQDPLDLAAPLLRLPLPERRARLREAAALRWHQKVGFARRRLEGFGWNESCHQLALEILGYRRNRAVMAEIGLRFPLNEWRNRPADFAEAVYASLESQWNRQGIRPPNHPRRRLQQYLALITLEPTWPERLRRAFEIFDGAGEEAESTREYRRRVKLGTWRRTILHLHWHKLFGTPRADTLFVDGFLPLAAAQLELPSLYPMWLHWPPGDLPASLRTFLRTAQVVTELSPYSNGLQQASLQFLFRA